MWRPVGLCVFYIECFCSFASGTGWEQPSPEAPSRASRRQEQPDRPLGSTSRLLPHPLAMSLIQGIDPDSLPQGGWPLVLGWLKSSHLNMAAAQVFDPGSNHRDHAAQHLDASARHPLRLAAEASFSTHPPRAPGLHPHGEPTPLLAHTAAAAVTGHTLAAASSGRSPPAGEQTPPRPVVVSGGRPDSHALPVVGDRAATAPAHTAWLAEGPPAGCSRVAAGASLVGGSGSLSFFPVRCFV